MASLISSGFATFKNIDEGKVEIVGIGAQEEDQGILTAEQLILSAESLQGNVKAI